MPWWWPFTKPWVEAPVDESVEESIDDDDQVVAEAIVEDDESMGEHELLDSDNLIDDDLDLEVDDYEEPLDGDGHPVIDSPDLLDYEEYETYDGYQPTLGSVPDEEFANVPTSPRRTRSSSAAQRTSSSEHPSGSPQFTPRSPHYRPTSPQHRPESPRYTASSPSPRYHPTSPRYRPTSPQYRPDSPPYTATSPPYHPSLPRYVQASPTYRPNSPVCNSASTEGQFEESRSSPRRYPLRRTLSSQLRDDFPSPPTDAMALDAPAGSAQAPIEIDDDEYDGYGNPAQAPIEIDNDDFESDDDEADIEVVDLSSTGVEEAAPEGGEAAAEDVAAVTSFGVLERSAGERNAVIGLSFGPQLENLVRRGYTPAEAFSFVGGLFDSHVDAYGAYDVATGRYRDFFTPQMTTLYHFLCGEIIAVARTRGNFRHQQDEARARVRRIVLNSGHPCAQRLANVFNSLMLQGFDPYYIYEQMRYYETYNARSLSTQDDIGVFFLTIDQSEPLEVLEHIAPNAMAAMAESWLNAQAGEPGYGAQYRSPATSPLRGVYGGQSPSLSARSSPTAQQRRGSPSGQSLTFRGQSLSPSASSSRTFGRGDRSPTVASPRPYPAGPVTYPIPRWPGSSSLSSSSSSSPSSSSSSSSSESTFHPPSHSPSTVSPSTPGEGAFDDFMTANRPRDGKRTPTPFKDYRVKKVDPLRYQNRLSQPRRLPNTPTKSHMPPSPRRRGPKPTKCETCGRAFRPRKKTTAAARRKSERVRNQCSSS